MVITSSTRNRVGGKTPRGFESHRLRQNEHPHLSDFCSDKWGPFFAIVPHWRPSVPCYQTLNLTENFYLPLSVGVDLYLPSGRYRLRWRPGFLDRLLAFILSTAHSLAYWGCSRISLISNIFSVLLARGKRMPCRRCFAARQSLFNPPQYCFYQMKPQIAKYKYYHKKQQECSDLFPRHNLPHFVAK